MVPNPRTPVTLLVPRSVPTGKDASVVSPPHARKARSATAERAFRHSVGTVSRLGVLASGRRRRRDRRGRLRLAICGQRLILDGLVVLVKLAGHVELDHEVTGFRLCIFVEERLD